MGMVVAVDGASNESRSTSELTGLAFGGVAVATDTAVVAAALEDFRVEAPLEVFEEVEEAVVVDADAFDLLLGVDLVVEGA